MKDFGSIADQLYSTRHVHSWIDVARNWVDILLVALVLYRLLLLVRSTRAWRLFLGITAFIGILAASKAVHFETLYWILDKATLLGPVALVILFLPELRQGLEGLGKSRFLSPIADRVITAPLTTMDLNRSTVTELVAAVEKLAAESTGALIVIERTVQLDEIAMNGVQINGRLTADLLGAVFYEGNPLHDGAVIVRGDRILAAACRLPLSESSRLSQNVHMRHRAGVGVTELYDALAIIVSEERGTISVASEGMLRPLQNHMELRELLNRELRADAPKARVRARKVRAAAKHAVREEPAGAPVQLEPHAEEPAMTEHEVRP